MARIQITKNEQGLKLNSISHSFGPSLQAQSGASLYPVTKGSQSETGSVPLRTPQHGVVRGTQSYLSAQHVILHAQLQPHCWSLQLALAAAPAATRVLTNKGFCNTQHLQRGKTTLIVTGAIPLGKCRYPFDGGGISLRPLLFAPSWSFYSQGPQRELTHFQMCASIQLDHPVEGSWGC